VSLPPFTSVTDMLRTPAGQGIEFETVT
jgi:hypothetical protein